MGTRKYDWEELKLKYLQSTEPAISIFLKNEIWMEVLTGHAGKKTKGWTEEKLAMRDKAVSIAKKNMTIKLWKAFTPTQEEISQWYEAAFRTLSLKAQSNLQKMRIMEDGTIIIPPDVSMTETKTLWEIFKTERGEPVRITDREDYVPPSDDNDDEDVIFILPDNGRDTKLIWARASQDKEEK